MSHALYREDHPLVFVITHWVNVICITVLALSGFYIHYPFFGGFMGVARGMHFVAMFVVLINLVLRIILAFVVKDANMPDTREVDTDIKNWLPQKANRHQLWPWIKYYLFLKKDHPISAKYGVLQKIAYLLTIPLTLAAGYTGLCLFGPTMDWPMFQSATLAVNGLMNMRVIHYFIMWAILIFTAAHVYLANIYNFAPSRMIFMWKENVPGKQ